MVCEFRCGDIAQRLQRVMEFFGVVHQRPRLFADPRDRVGIEQTVIFRLGRVRPRTIANRIGATFFCRCVVKKRIGASVNYFLGKGRRFAKVFRDKRKFLPFDFANELYQGVDIHRLG